MLGLPWLAAVIGGLLLKLFEFFSRFLAKKLALVAAGVAAAGAITAAFVAAGYSLVGSISASLPGELFAHVGLFIPGNAGDCVAVLVTARIAVWVYWWNIKVIDWKMTANL